MELSEFTFITTEACNSKCSYCPQNQEEKTISNSLIENAIDFFYPFFNEDMVVNFYGGEPLLAFLQIQHTVTVLKRKNKKLNKKILYKLTTNGSLITKDILEFFNSHGFSVTISFDGLAHDICRKRGNFQETVSVIKQAIKYFNIKLSTNSVFTSETIGYLSQSIQLIAELGVPTIRFALSTIKPWDETALIRFREQLAAVKKFLLDWYKLGQTIPVINFSKGVTKAKEKRTIFACFAGKDRMALTPDGKLWGCYRFPEYFKGKEDTGEYQELFFGDLDDLIKNDETFYPKILDNYSSFRQDLFYTAKTFCYMCEEVERCGLCPVSAAQSTACSQLGEISSWECKIQRIQRKIVNEFYQQLKH